MTNFVVPLLAVASLLTISTATKVPKSYCVGIANGVFLPDFNSCQHFYLCSDGEAIPGKCPNGYKFNGKKQMCDYADKTDCFECPSKSLKVFRIAKACSKYVMCFDGQPVIRECVDRLQFNDETGRCDFAENLDCQDDVCSRTNSMAERIVFAKSHAACDKYFVCHKGIPTKFECTEGLHFSSAFNDCDLPQRTSCSIKQTQRTIPAVNRVVPQRASIKCPAKGTHFYPDPKNYNKYFLCVNGKSAVLSCTQGLVYDDAVKECRKLENVEK